MKKGTHHNQKSLIKLRNSLKGRKVWNKGIKGLQSWHNISGFKPGWNKGKKFPQITGSKHFNWKGGRNKHKDGYIYILKPEHPLADKKGYIFEHRLIMEQMLRRYLKKEERVHHINNIHNDNRPENLMYFPNESEHQKFHQILKH